MFGRSGADLEMGADGLLKTFRKSKRSKRSWRGFEKVEPETN